jgi:hypothetical protein
LGLSIEFWLIGTYNPKEADANERGDWLGIPNSILISFKPNWPDDGRAIIYF